jgi:hypothetical protein
MTSCSKPGFTRLLLTAAFGVALLFFASGDDGKSESQKAEESVREKFGEEGLIRAGIVVRAYDEGRLGTHEQVEADMERFF